MFAFLEQVSAFGVVVIDPEARVVLFNRAAEEQFQRQAAEVQGRPLAELLVQAGAETLGRRRDGAQFPAEAARSPFSHDGRTYTVLFVRDISLRRQVESRKDEAVALASHEIRAPITSIGVALGIMAQTPDLALPDNVRRLLIIADRECRRLRRLVEDYLSLAKMESGGAPFTVARAELAPLVLQALEAVRPSADNERVGLEFVDEAHGAAAVVDADRFVQAAVNLFSNAVKFSPPGAAVTATLSCRDGRVRLGVRDRGPGIPAAFRERIFRKFAQAVDSEAIRKKGTGLGLSIVKAICERLGGNVGFESVPGDGATFHIEFPAA